MGSVTGRAAALAFLILCECGGKRPERPDSSAGGVSGGLDAGGGSGLVGTTGGAGLGADGASGAMQGGRGGDAGSGGAVGGSDGSVGAAGAGGSGGGNTGSCGGYDQPCCAMGACGQPDAICKSVDVIDAGVISARQLCVRCGEPGHLCCARKSCNSGCCVYDRAPDLGGGRHDWTCLAHGTACPVGGNCEPDGSCSTCGGAGETCCEERVSNPGVHWCTIADTTCVREETAQTGTCQPCGELDQPCCFSTEQAFPVGTCRSPLRCTSQICRTAT